MQALNEVLSGPGDAITPQQRSALLKLAQHFGLMDKGDRESDHESEEEEEDEDEGGDEDSTSGPRGRRPKPGKSGSKTRHPWAPFMRLRSVELAYPIQHHLRTHGPDAEKFLSDSKLLTHEIFDPQGTVSDKFMACYQYTLQLTARRSKDNIRWCFTMLMYFDLVKVVKPNSSGRKVGYLMLKDITRFLGSASTTIDPKIAHKQLNKWAGFGRKLDLLCSTFGPGCVFYLVDLLSTNLYAPLPPVLSVHPLTCLEPRIRLYRFRHLPRRSFRASGNARSERGSRRVRR